MIERVSIPISSCSGRIRFLDACLTSILFNSKNKHDIIVVTEDYEYERMKEYFHKWIDFPNVRLIPSRPVIAQGYEGSNPVYQFLNEGAQNSKEDWLLMPAGDDSYFPKGWDVLLDKVDPEKFMTHIWTPKYICVNPFPGNEEERKHYGGPDGCVNRYEYRYYPRKNYALESEIIKATERWKENRIFTELVGDRHEIGWAHSVINKKLFFDARMYKTHPPYPAGNDMDFCVVLKEKNIHTFAIAMSVIVNCRIPMILGQ